MRTPFCDNPLCPFHAISVEKNVHELEQLDPIRKRVLRHVYARPRVVPQCFQEIILERRDQDVLHLCSVCSNAVQLALVPG